MSVLDCCPGQFAGKDYEMIVLLGQSPSNKRIILPVSPHAKGWGGGAWHFRVHIAGVGLKPYFFVGFQVPHLGTLQRVSESVMIFQGRRRVQGTFFRGDFACSEALFFVFFGAGYTIVRFNHPVLVQGCMGVFRTSEG